MHPPFFVVDHKVGPQIPLPHHERQFTRRTAPEVLRLSILTPGTSFVSFARVPLATELAPAPLSPAAQSPKGGNGNWFARFWRQPQRSQV